MNLAIPKESQSLSFYNETTQAGPCLTKSSVFLIKNLAQPAWFQQGTRLFIPLTIFKNKYHQPSFKMLFISFVHSAFFFYCCPLPEQSQTGKLFIFQTTLLLGPQEPKSIFFKMCLDPGENWTKFVCKILRRVPLIYGH